MEGISSIYKRTRSIISKKFFSNLHHRDKSVFKNIGLGFASKGISVFLSFLQIPITLSILTKTEYGIWLTLFSIAGWLAFFDLGLGNGLRNKLTEALAEGNFQTGKKLVSTAYVALSGIFFLFIFLFSIVAFFIPWDQVLKSSSIPKLRLLILVYCCFICSILNFVANLIQVIFAANHLTGKGNLLVLFNQIIILLITLLIKYVHPANSFLLIGIFLSIVPLFVNVVASVYYFKTRFKVIAPEIKYFNKIFLKDVMTLGIKFFIIQVAGLIIFTTDNFLITQLYTPADVASYSFVFKYFSVISLFFGIVSMPLWTMYSDAFKKNDIEWIENNIKRLLKLFLFGVFAVILMTLMSNFLLTLWLGNAYSSSMFFVFMVGVYILQTIWNSIFAVPINAIGKLNIQLGLAIWAAVINIPLAIYLSHVIGNVVSIVLANILSLIVGSIVIFIQYNMEIKKMQNQNLLIK